jgi:2,4-diaminopentanoate dehydrogenase
VPVDVAIVTTSSSLASCAPTFRTLLERGLPVVSTCEELLYPRLRHAALADELDGIARRHGGRLLGTGVNPGLLMDTLPALATAACRSVERIDVWRVQDATTRRVPFQRKIGAGLTPEEFQSRVADGSLRHVGLGESLWFLAEATGLEPADWNESIEPVIAEREVRCDIGEISRGGIAGVRQVASGLDASGRERVRLEFVAAIGQVNPHDRIRIKGDPPLDLTIAGGVHGDVATVAITINAMEPLIAAAPGLHSMRTIGLPSCRYHA